jgi:membrane-associated phospholipid phosphatase
VSTRTRLILAAVAMLGLFAVLAAVVSLSAPARPGLDSHMASSLHRVVLARPGLASALRLIGRVTDPWWVRAIALIAVLLLTLRGRRGAAAWLVITMATGGVLGNMLKLILARSRPEWPDPVTTIGGYSLPSGHAVNSMLAAACAIVLLDPMLPGAGRARVTARWALWLLAAGFVLLVGFDRLALGVHFVTDVLAGWALALATVFATLAGLGPRSTRP